MTRGSAIVVVMGVISAIVMSVASRVISIEYGKAFAKQSAIVISDYLTLVAPPARRAAGGAAGYDVGQLLAHARALDLLPPWTSHLEVYHGTAPLVHSTAPPLTPDQFGRLRRLEAAEWRAGGRAVLVPLTDRDRWDVLGAVEVTVPGGGPGWWLGIIAPALVAGLAVFMRVARGAPLGFYWSAALVIALFAVWSLLGTVAAFEASWTEAMHGLTEGHAVASKTMPHLELETTVWIVVLVSLTLLGPCAATVFAWIASARSES